VIEEQGEVVFNRRVNANTWLMGISSPGVARSAGPGQFVMLRVRGGVDPLLRRPFSVCGVQNDLFHILYRVVGKGTEILSREVKKGDRLSVLGPLGRGFRVPSERGTSLLVAGGIGIAPLLFLASAQGARPFRFMAGFASAREIIPMGEISNLPLDADISTDDGSAGHGGLVTDLLEERLRQEGGETFSIYTCGPKPMLKKIASISAGRGLPCQGSLESAMACGLGACQGCAVKAAPGEGRTYFHVCKDGPVFDIQQIDWEAL
jgi:dihydroorotate dehydrogenase electron transfer subunit